MFDFLEPVPAIAWSALGFCVGFLLEHWLQIGRDRRLELERAKGPVREWILHQQIAYWTLIHRPKIEDLDGFESRLSPRKRRQFRQAFQQLLDSYHAKYNELNEVLYDVNEEDRVAALKALSRLTRPN